MTNEQILQAVNNLTDTYNQIQQQFSQQIQQFSQRGIELYKNNVIIWDGLTDKNINDSPVSDIIKIGKATIKRYGLWNNHYMIQIMNNNSIASVSSLPKDFIVIKVKIPNPTKDGAFFLLKPIADTWGYGFIQTYIYNPNTQSIKQSLGFQIEDKYSDIGHSPVFSPINTEALIDRYHQWMAYPYVASDLVLDSKGYAYFALSNTNSHYYISGWAIAETTTDFLWTNSMLLERKYYDSVDKPINNGHLWKLQYSYFHQNTSYNDIRVPYKKLKNLTLGFINIDDHYIVQPTIKGQNTYTVYQQSYVNKGNFGKIFLRTEFRPSTFFISEQEVQQNTIVINGLNLLRLRIEVPANHRHFYFAGVWTE